MNARRLLSSVALAVAVLTSGCMSPYLKRAPNAPEPKPSEALIAGLTVRFDSSGEKSLLDAAVDAAQNAQLEEFGKQATQMSATVLAEHGYTAAYDQARSAKLDVVQIASNSGAAALTGMWRHPESSHMGPENVEALLTTPREVLSKIIVEGKSEYFAFTNVVIRDNGMFMKEPYVIVRTAIFDSTGKKVLDLRGIGSGESSFMFADRSPKNLQLALERGFESLKTAEPQAL